MTSPRILRCAALVASLCALTLSLPASTDQTSTDQAASVQRTDGDFASRAPAWSPDGSRIAFESDRDGDWNLYVLDVTSDAVRRLTTSEATDRAPAWSPDGKTLVFVSDRGSEPGGARDLYTLDVATGAVELLAGVTGNALFPSWSPDGGGVVFTRRLDDSFEILRLRLDASTAEPVLETSARELWPRWSPDGRRLAFFSRRDTDGEDDEVYVWTRGDAEPMRLTERAGHDFCPAWSPDGQHIVMVSVEPDGSRALRVLDLDGRETGRLATGYHRVTEPAWSPDGRSIAYAAIRAEGESYQLFIEPAPR